MRETVRTSAGRPPYLILLAILAIATYLRVLNLSWGVPELHPFAGRYMAHLYPDEPALIDQIRGISHSLLDIKTFAYPPLHAQISALLSWIFQTSRTPGLYFWARAISVMASLLTIVCLYVLGRSINQRVALIASAFLAVSMVSVREAHWANPESLNAFWIMLAILMVFRTEGEQVSSKNFLLIGLALALSICSKYFGVLFFHLPILLLIKGVLEKKARINRRALLYLAISYATIIVVLGALLIPYILKNKETFLAYLEYHSGWQSHEHGIAGLFPKPVTTPTYLGHILPVALGYPLYFLSTGGIILSLVTRSKTNLLLLACVLPFWITLENLRYPILRFSVTLAPALALWAAYFCDYLLKSKTKLIALVGLLLLAFVLTYSFMYSYAFINVLNVKRDIRFAIEEWVNAHVPDRSQLSLFAHNLTDNSLGFVQYTAMDQFNGPDYRLSQRLPQFIIAPRIFLDDFQQCLQFREKGYTYSEKDWWPFASPVPETLNLAEDLLAERNYKVIAVFKNQAAFNGIRFKDDRLKFDYLWFTNLEVFIYQRCDNP